MSLFQRPVTADTRSLAAGAAADCAAIHAASFSFPWTAAEIENLVMQPNVAGDTALDGKNGKLYGFVLSRIACDEAEVLSIAVDPVLRRRGIATNLLAAHLGRLRNSGVKA